MTKKRPSVLVMCQECELEFSAIAYEVKRGNGKFCSRKCQRSHQAKINAAAAKGHLTQAEMNARSRDKTPKLVKLAHRAVEAAIRSGSLTRMPCEVCGAVRVDAHHDDYTKPLDVRWLCRGHHLKHHRS